MPNLVSTGALDTGSITTGFGAINNGTSNITTSGTISYGTLNDGTTNLTATAAELNIMDGGTTATGTTVADTDRVVLNDNGTMVQVAVTDLAAYFDDEITAMPNLVTTAATTVGALNSGSISTGFGAINNGSSNITTSGKITYGTLNDGSNDLSATAAQLNTYILNVALDDISTNGKSCYVVAPKAGTITKISSIIDGTISVDDALITANVNGGADIPDSLTGILSFAISNASNAGTIDSCTPGSNNTVTAGQYISLRTNGASSGAVKAVFTIEITY